MTVDQLIEKLEYIKSLGMGDTIVLNHVLDPVNQVVLSPEQEVVIR